MTQAGMNEPAGTSSAEQAAASGASESVLKESTAELATGLALFGFGAVVVADSIRVGMGWGADGPEAGFYPFYVGLILCACSAWIAAQPLLGGPSRAFVDRAPFVRVVAVFLPSLAFVVGMFWLGAYVASALFLAGFMRWQGKFRWRVAAPLALGVSAALFFAFEVGFGVPLPKGPVEAAFGY
jgi:putative tricarboxylic transport membrane protein